MIICYQIWYCQSAVLLPWPLHSNHLHILPWFSISLHVRPCYISICPTFPSGTWMETRRRSVQQEPSPPTPTPTEVPHRDQSIRAVLATRPRHRCTAEGPGRPEDHQRRWAMRDGWFCSPVWVWGWTLARCPCPMSSSSWIQRWGNLWSIGAIASVCFVWLLAAYWHALEMCFVSLFVLRVSARCHWRKLDKSGWK